MLERADTAEAIGLNRRASALLDQFLMGRGRGITDQFPASGEAFPFPIFVHLCQTSVTVASNPMRLFRRRECQGQANLQQTTFDVTIHHLKPNPADRAPLAANCHLFRISCPRRGGPRSSPGLNLSVSAAVTSWLWEGSRFAAECRRVREPERSREAASPGSRPDASVWLHATRL